MREWVKPGKVALVSVSGAVALMDLDRLSPLGR